MDDVDRMIVESLVKLQCTFCADSLPKSLACLSTDNVVEAVVRFLWACDPSTQKNIPSYKLPSHTTGRFKMATLLADAIKGVGIREDFGYQTFLYHSIFDVRRIFLALIDKLPEESMQVEVNLTPLERLKQEAGASIAKHLNEPWVPEFCRYLRLKYDGKFWCPNEDQSEDYSFFCQSNKYDNRRIICSMLDQLESKAEGEMDYGSQKFSTSSIIFEDVSAKGSKPVVAAKPKIAAKPVLPPKPLNLTAKCTTETHEISSPTQTKDDAFSPVNSEINNLLEEISSKQSQLETKKKEVLELNYAQIRLQEEVKRAEQAIQQNDERLFQLVKDPEASVAKLQRIVEESDQRKVELEERFFDVRMEKEAELDQLKATQKVIPATSCNLQQLQNSQLAKMIQQVEESEIMLVEKKRIKNKLEKEVRKITSTGKPSNERSKYITRVLEIVANVNKQNEEIYKTVQSVRKIEYEINSLSGNLDRTFIVVDRWLGQQTENSAKMQKAYKLLVRMHEQCSLVKSAISETGQVTRQINELTDQIEIEEQKSVDSQLDRLLNDLMHLRQENKELAV
uniref:Coiled-coil domain-containing protein 22 homolog n=1 Tax=Ditylenchus dipsaci TaxID=166011 RepID=A0A915DKA0_9BILA